MVTPGIAIGLGFLVAGLETAWMRTGHERWPRPAKFYGKRSMWGRAREPALPGAAAGPRILGHGC
jgi:hypothetical protein